MVCLLIRNNIYIAEDFHNAMNKILEDWEKIGSSLIAEEAIRYSKFSDKTWIRASKEFRNNFLDYNNINLTNL